MKDYNAIAKQMRLERGVSQEDIALAIGVSQTTISRYETNKRNISYMDLREIARALRYDLIFKASDRKSEYTYRARRDQYVIKAMRLRRALSTREMAEKLNVNNSTISNYETGRRRISQETMKMIAYKLDFDIDILIMEV